MKANLKQLLKDKNLRLADLSREAGVDKATVTRWAQKRVPAERVIEIEAITGISRHELRPDLFKGVE
ncbi:helix-turn-helix domain-containing protein [Brucella oryzae]|uniref:YdaS family helix-turn-helix protein n=1 Tax=Brucella oryzae TaxID=335286 RepID=UPI001B8260C0|nr:YdaS family helix-turn-helix protein [Brucella oryzae]MBR7654844.1 helix-turn-helix domain-containing protein [Brucella oryzae]